MNTIPSEEDVLAAIGRIIIVSQFAERTIQFCMTFVMQKDAPLTIEKLEAQTAAERRKTLGYFLGQLRQRAEIREDFDQLLTRFLDMRNTLIHRVDEIEGWDLKDPMGRETALRFLHELGASAARVAMIFTGFVRAWQQQAGIPVPIPPGADEFFSEIDSKYAHLIDHLLSEKEDT